MKSKYTGTYSVCRSLPTGPNKLAIMPLGATTDWNFRQCTRLWPLYMTRWFSPGRQIGLIVPSTNPQQLSKAAPFWWMARANSGDTAVTKAGRDLEEDDLEY